MSNVSQSHTSVVQDAWKKLVKIIKANEETVAVNGTSLTIEEIYLIARHRKSCVIQHDIIQRLARTEVGISEALSRGNVIYGVNTGFGGSADSRTKKVEQLQSTLIRELLYGIAPKEGGGTKGSTSCTEQRAQRFRAYLPNEDPVATNDMPESWVRASIIVRINSLLHGFSGVRPVVVERMAGLLEQDIIPRIPLHGSISASGDLSPLAYVGATLQGSQHVMVSRRTESSNTIETARMALREIDIQPLSFLPKEGLAIVNGTAVSCGVAALALYEVHLLAVMSQILTAMSVEALRGSVDSFDPLLSKVRPHPGQIDSAHNIQSFLTSSKLTAVNVGREAGVLLQDRYSIRTAPQWIGPALDDICLAHQQITIECNSVTDNPIIDKNNSSRSLMGGNFQAKAVTSATEKLRQAIQTVGRMLFTQCTEMINPATNRGLPPNLVIDESFIFKAIDLSAAATLSELGFLANPVGTHVQTAEMGNQALNSLALISARYTHVAADLLSRLVAAHLLAVCQALDLRALQLRFLDTIKDDFDSLVGATAGRLQVEANRKITLGHGMWAALLRSLEQTAGLDSGERFLRCAGLMESLLVDAASSISVESLRTWRSECAELLHRKYISTRRDYLLHGTAHEFLGEGSKIMYEFVRKTLGVPFLHTEILVGIDMANGDHRPQAEMFGSRNTTGDYIKIIYDAIKDGSIVVPILDNLESTFREAPWDGMAGHPQTSDSN